MPKTQRDYAEFIGDKMSNFDEKLVEEIQKYRNLFDTKRMQRQIRANNNWIENADELEKHKDKRKKTMGIYSRVVCKNEKKIEGQKW